MKTKTLFAGIAVLTFIGQSELHAQATWTGTGTSGTPALWSVGSNWSANAPASGATISLLFNNTAANSFSNNDLTGLTVSGISIPATSGGVNVKDNTITGNAITLSGGVTVATGNYQTIGLNIALASGSGSFSQSTGQTTFSGQISGSEAISKTGGGTVVFSGPNNFSGNVTVSGGALSVTHNSSLGTTAGKTTANGGSLQLSNNVTITGETLEIAGNGGGNTTGALRNSSGNNTWTGNITTIGNDSRILAAAGTLTISGILSSSNAGNNQVILRGEGGTIELTNANSYGGTTRVFGTAGNAATVPMLRLSGGDNRLPIGTTIDIGGGGVSGSMEIVGVSQEVAGLVSNSGATTSKISGSGTATLVVNNSATGTFTGTLTDSLAFTKTGSASYTLSGNNTYSRGTTVNGGTLKVAHAAALGIGTVNLNAGSGAVLQLATDTSVNAYNLTMGSNRFNTIVSDKATASTAGIVHTLGTLSLGASTLTINKGANATGSTAGVSFASVDLSAGNNDRNVILNGDGVISLGSVAALSNNIGFTGGPGNGGTVANKVLQLDGTNASNAVTGVISNTNNTGSTVVSLIKSSSSTWTLQSDNTYTGTTTIKGGTLKLNTSTSIGSSPTITVGDAGSTNAVLDVTTAGFTVGASQTLGGIGTILATGQTVTASGTLSAGNSVGTLTIDGGTLALDSTSDFIFELGSSSDRINLINSASLSLGLNTLGLADFLFSDSGGFGEGVYTLISGASSFSGALDASDVTGDVLGYNSTLSMSGNNLILTVVPEPGTALLGSLGLLALLRRRRIG
jgi:autotransporter-associated beta strand protein